MCPHMKRMSLANIRRALETMTHEVTVDPGVADRARAAVERMLLWGRRRHERLASERRRRAVVVGGGVAGFSSRCDSRPVR